MAKRKTFVTDAQLQGNPALSFISQESVDAVEGRPEAQEEPVQQPLPSTAKPPQGYKRNPEFIEVKSKRVQLVMQPSLYDRVKAASKAIGVSFNEYCHRVLDQATREGGGEE